MKKHLIVFTLFVLVLLAGCSANRNTGRVDVRLNANNQQLLAANATGSMIINEWLETKSQQSMVETQAYYLTRAQQASTSKESQEWLDLAAQVSGSGGSTMATLVNASSYRMTILDGPYAGTTLEPGQSSSPARVPVGVVNFRALSASSIGQDFYVDVIRKVSAGDKTIVLVNKTR